MYGRLERQRGISVVEILASMAILAAIAPALVSTSVSVRDSLQARWALEEAVSLISRARWTAISRGGARLVFSDNPASGRIVASGGKTIAEAALGKGVSLELPPGVSETEISFGATGLGAVASRTLRFRAGAVVKTLVISSLGRVRKP